MKRLFKLISILAILIIILIGLSLSNNSSQNKKSTASPSPTIASKTILDAPKEQIQQYYNVYKNPYVIYLRKALNAYLANDSSQACIFQGAVSGRVDKGIVTGLDSFDKNYYKSKFIVFTIDKDKENGENIQIIFQDEPDRIFYAWVGDNPYKELCLLGFNSNENTDKKALREILDYYGPLIFDKNHAL